MTRKRARITISLLMSLVMALCFLVSGVLASDDSLLEELDLSQLYRKYDFETGEVTFVPRYAAPSYQNGKQIKSTSPYIPEDAKGIIGDRTVFGDDDRLQVTNTTTSPYYGIARLVITYTDNTSATGTGFLVAPNVMLTAGHCCMSASSNAPIASFTAYLGQNETYVPMTAYLSYYYVCANFTSFNGPDKDDYAIMVLSSSPGNTTGWFGLSYQNNMFFVTNPFTITGYPIDKTSGTMWKASGAITECSTYVLSHIIDCYAGQSGSPIYMSNVAYGILVSENAVENRCRRMTQEVFDWLVAQGFIS